MKKILICLVILFLLTSCFYRNRDKYEIIEGTYESIDDYGELKFEDLSFSKIIISLSKINNESEFDRPLICRANKEMFAISIKLKIVGHDEFIQATRAYCTGTAYYNKNNGYRVGAYTDWGEYTTTFYWELNFREPQSYEKKEGIKAAINMYRDSGVYKNEIEVDEDSAVFFTILYLKCEY